MRAALGRQHAIARQAQLCSPVAVACTCSTQYVIAHCLSEHKYWTVRSCLLIFLVRHRTNIVNSCHLDQHAQPEHAMFIMAKLFNAHGYACESQQSCDRATFVRLLRHPNRRCETPISIVGKRLDYHISAATRRGLVRMLKRANEVYIFPSLYN
jgi:hypothetical protein